MVLKRLTPMAAKEKKRQQSRSIKLPGCIDTYTNSIFESIHSRSIKLPGSVVERAWEGHGRAWEIQFGYYQTPVFEQSSISLVNHECCAVLLRRILNNEPVIECLMMDDGGADGANQG